MQVISKSEIQVDPEHVLIVWRFRDEWGREIVNSVVLYRPVKEWKREG
jgi:hypothetical protein